MSKPALQDVWNVSNPKLDEDIGSFLKRTKQDHLPQAKILADSIAALESKGMVEAYLRGSFCKGEADIYSDIDLFTVVEPDKVEDVYNEICAFLNKGSDILVSCHDKLVKDYGGVGFMFLCTTQDNQVFQFDFYMALKGIEPKSYVLDTVRVYHADDDYCWLDCAKNRKSDIPQNTELFFKKVTEGTDPAEKTLFLVDDMMVTMNIMAKHLTRGQRGRALKDNNHLMGLCTEMLRPFAQTHFVDDSLYAADKVLSDCAASNNPQLVACGDMLGKMLFQPPGFDKIDNMMTFLDVTLETLYPDIHKQVSPRLESYKDGVLDKYTNTNTKQRLKTVTCAPTGKIS